MDETWEPIRRTGAPLARDIHGPSQRVELVFPLSATPPREWASGVIEGIARRTEDAGPHPRIDGDGVHLWSKPSEEEFKAWAEALDGMIENANRFYESKLDKDRQTKTAIADAEAQRLQKLEQYNAWAKNLKPPSSGA
jgi:hypothetical protein